MNFHDKEMIEDALKAEKIGNIKEAEELYNEAIIANPKNATPYFSLGNLYHKRGEIGKAIKAFSKSLELDPCHTECAISLSVIYNDIGKYEEAQKIFETASERVKSLNSADSLSDIHINKKFAQRHFEIAEQYFTYGKYDDALFEYSKAAALDPDNSDLKLKIAKTHAKKGFVNKAIDELKKLKTEKPNYIPARLALGLIYFGSGNVIEAQQEWLKILSIEPQNTEAKTYLVFAENATETKLN